MKNKGKLTRYTPEKPVHVRAIHQRNEQNIDWQTVVRNAENTSNQYYVLTDDDGHIRSVNTDISTLTPINMTLREIPESELPADFTISWSEMTIIDGVLTYNHHVKTEREKQRLLSEAKNKITVLQYAVDLGIATEDELAQLDKWKEYVVMETRANT